ncbi:gag-pol polyprotein [Tanacetum coccineum]
MKNYKNVSEDIRNLLNAEAGVVHIILTGIDNDIYSTVDACPNAMERWKAIERLKQEPDMVTEDDALSKEKEIDKLMALISLSFKKIYKPTNNNLRTPSNTSTQVVQQSGIQCYNYKEYGHVARECQKPKRAKDSAYHKEKELEAHYLYMAKIQEVSPDAADNSGPIFDAEPLQRVQDDDEYNVFANDRKLPKQPKYVNDTYPDEQGDNNIIIDSLDMSTNGDQAIHDDDYLARECQSVQTMNMLNRNCKTSFVKPEFLKKAQRANPRLYDIGCYNDNLA